MFTHVSYMVFRVISSFPPLFIYLKSFKKFLGNFLFETFIEELMIVDDFLYETKLRIITLMELLSQHNLHVVSSKSQESQTHHLTQSS